MIISTNQLLDHQEISDLVFQGKVIHFKQINANVVLVNKIQELSKRILQHNNPIHSFKNIDENEWLIKIKEYQDLCAQDSEIIESFKYLIASFGNKLDKTYKDRLAFRAIRPQQFCMNKNNNNSFLTPHRDTWGAGIYEQINWWAPVFDYAENTGIEFYPYYWCNPIKNNTQQWSLKEYLAERKKTPLEFKPSYSTVPSALELPKGEKLAINISVGDLICFASAHLHGSGTNNSNQCRMNWETRTINLEDVVANKQAPNIDNKSNAKILKLFSRMDTGESLTQSLFN